MATNATISAERSVKFRVRFPAGGKAALSINVSVGARVGAYFNDILPAKEMCFTDDVLNVSDSASFTVANVGGENSGKFVCGMRVEIDESDPKVAGGQWCRVFTGRVVAVKSRSGASGSEILVSMMDLGWHLTSSHGLPLQNINGITIERLIQDLVDPSWGFASTVVSGTADLTVGNALNRTLKQGRQGILRTFAPVGSILPFIQVEPGQAPWDILQLYLTRTGYLLNVGVQGNLVLFQPSYDGSSSPYGKLHYYPETSAQRQQNNIIGTPELTETIDGLYTEVQCWSTVVKPTAVLEAEIGVNPNAQYTHSTYTPDTAPLPFARRHVFSDGEAINETLRHNRAVWKYQMGAFQSWQYEVDVQGHSSAGAFYASDTMIGLDDAFHGVKGSYYVQSVRREFTMHGGARTHLSLRKPGLLNPGLNALGGGAQQAQETTVIP